MPSVTEAVAELDARTRTVMAFQAVAVLGIILAFVGEVIGFGTALAAFAAVFVLTGVAYAYLTVLGS